MNEKLKRSIEVDKQNQMLLDRLLKIKQEKSTFSKDVCKPSSHANGPPSLQIKKKEAKRIDRENQRLLVKIINQGPQIATAKNYQDDYSKNVTAYKLRRFKNAKQDLA